MNERRTISSVASVITTFTTYQVSRIEYGAIYSGIFDLTAGVYFHFL